MDSEGGAAMIYWCYSDAFPCDEPKRVEATSAEEASVRYAESMALRPSVYVAGDENSAFNGEGVEFKIEWSAKAVRR